MKWIFLAVLATPAFAQDVPFSPEATETCLASAETSYDNFACIPASATACYDAGGGSNAEYGGCMSAGADYWDARLNDVYRRLLSQHEEVDAEMAELESSAAPMAPALREMQRNWIPYRDAACAHEAVTWGGGSGASPAFAECMMNLTGEQTLRLEAYLNEGEDG